MLEQGIIKEIKQNDVSKDKEKTKSRVKEIWMPLEKSKREEVFALSGITKFTVQRTYTNGNISAKLAVVMAQVLKIDPYYLTGDVDEQQVYSDDLLVQFLKDKGYGKLFDGSKKQKRKYSQKKKTEATVNDSATNPASEPVEPIDDGQSDIPEETVSIDEAPIPDSLPENYLSTKLLSMAYDCIKSLPEAEISNLDSMSEEDAILLTKSLLLRARFNEDAKFMASFAKLILTI